MIPRNSPISLALFFMHQGGTLCRAGSKALHGFVRLIYKLTRSSPSTVSTTTPADPISARDPNLIRVGEYPSLSILGNWILVGFASEPLLALKACQGDAATRNASDIR